MNPPDEPEGEESEATLAHPVREGLSAFGRLLGKAASQVGTTIADAYMALDPDLKRHLAQMPLVGLTMLAPGRPKVEARGTGATPAVRGWAR